MTQLLTMTKTDKFETQGDELLYLFNPRLIEFPALRSSEDQGWKLMSHMLCQQWGELSRDGPQTTNKESGVKTIEL